MNSPTLFGIYTAKFPFLDSNQDKIRPVIVVGSPYGKHSVIAVVPVSSKAELEPVDVAITGWAAAGLLKPSIARVHRITSLLQSDLIAELGVLERDDRGALQIAMRLLLNL